METSQKNSIIQRIDATPLVQLATLPEVAYRFKYIYKVMNGGDVERASVKYEAEKFHIMKLIQDKPELQQCTKLSIYGCFLDMAVNGLSFDPSMKQAYVVAMPTNVGTKDSPKWEKRATLFISGYGELHMRVQQKQIKYADNPILVYEGDHFAHGTKDGKVFLEHAGTYPRQSENIIACYIRLERMDSSVDYKVLSIDEVLKLKAFSKQQNSLAWTSGLPGMIQAKTIKHAFRSYPKTKLGQFSKLESQAIEPEEPEFKIDYGLNGSMPASVTETTSTFTPTADTKPTVTTQQSLAAENDDFTQTEVKKGTSFDDDDF